jgi:two-component system, chemotaxis family, CheB/CheR fusion protein
MAVLSIEDGGMLIPNSIFVCPPGFHLRLNGLSLYLDACRTWGWPTTLSCFLTSLAGSDGPSSIAVILSGSGNDGSSALSAVRASGGLILAQSNPRWAGMPDSAVATGNVDFILNSRQIATALTAFGKRRQHPA